MCRINHMCHLHDYDKNVVPNAADVMGVLKYRKGNDVLSPINFITLF